MPNTKQPASEQQIIQFIQESHHSERTYWNSRLSGAITFISEFYADSISDREIVERGGILDLPFNEGDDVMADKGFTIEDLLPLGVSLNIPLFLGQSQQMPVEDVVKTQVIASLRIHVEKAIIKIKNFHIWDRITQLTFIPLVNQMWTVCSFL